MNFSAVILAGGKSARMGRDKAWLEVGGQTLLARQTGLAREIGAAEIFISGRADMDYAAFSGRVLLDEFPDAGPLAGIERALDASKSPLLLVLAVDLPAMSAELLRRLAAACSETCGAIPSITGAMEPLAAFYPKIAAGLLVNLLDDSFPLTPALSRGEKGNRSPSRGKSPAESGSEPVVVTGRFQRLSPLPGEKGRGEGERGVKKSASAKHFAGLCVQSGLARFIELDAQAARHFTNWNSPDDLASRAVKDCVAP